VGRLRGRRPGGAIVLCSSVEYADGGSLLLTATIENRRQRGTMRAARLFTVTYADLGRPWRPRPPI